jgi:hypothetical protein
VERYLDKLEWAILLFPKQDPPSDISANENREATDNWMRIYEMNTPQNRFQLERPIELLGLSAYRCRKVDPSCREEGGLIHGEFDLERFEFRLSAVAVPRHHQGYVKLVIPSPICLLLGLTV